MNVLGVTDGQWGALAAVFVGAMAATASLVVGWLNYRTTRSHANGAEVKHADLIQRFDQVDERLDTLDGRLTAAEDYITSPRKKAS